MRLREKKNVREKLNMPFWQQQLKEEISLAQVIPERGLRLLPDPASNATSQDTGERHAQTHGPQQKHAQPMANGITGRWKRSPPPRPREWNVHRDTLAHLGSHSLSIQTAGHGDQGAGLPAYRPWLLSQPLYPKQINSPDMPL